MQPKVRIRLHHVGTGQHLDAHHRASFESTGLLVEVLGVVERHNQAR